MPSPFVDSFRDRLSARAVVAWLGLLVVFRVLLDATLPQLLATGLMAGVAGTTEVAADAYDLRKSVTHAGTGLVAVVGGAAMLTFRASPPVLPVLFVLVGGWYVLDGVQTVRHEGATRTPRDGSDVFRSYVARRVHETLEDAPRTDRELHEGLDADDETIDAAIGDLLERDVLAREGSELRMTTSPDRGRLARIRSRAGAVGRRIARPFTMELTLDPSNPTSSECTPGDGGSEEERDVDVARSR